MGRATPGPSPYLFIISNSYLGDIIAVRMVDITNKDVVYREASAEGFIRLKRETLEMIKNGKIEKGDVLTVAKLAGLIAVKKVPELLPLCHPIPITHVDIETEILDDGIKVRATVKSLAQTGVEMEALTAVSLALLNIWDMVKRYEKDEYGQYPTTQISYVKVLSKVKVANT